MLTEKELEVLRRRAAGEGQQTIANSLRVTQAAVSKFESNAQRKILEAEELLRITKELNVFSQQTTVGRKVIYRGGRR